MGSCVLNGLVRVVVLTTVAGNLIENAFDAVEGQPRRQVAVHIRDRAQNL
jgi:sensor histidine kinase regulating citrate/malate metabolism